MNRAYTDIKMANNTKINHIMISFTDHYNAISVEWLPAETKIGKESKYFDNPHICKPEFSSATKYHIFSLKTQKNNHFSASDWWQNTEYSFKENATTFLIIPSLKKILKLQDLKKIAKRFQKSLLKPEIKPMIEILQN